VAKALGLTTRSQKRYVFGTQQVTIRPAASWTF
jgi:hypothetical protein